ncbi:MAG: hypothetical protein IPM29_26380 [Planctomycetes bacterium]|nr:hypothetical protein [Planctomycetota bacterium]
MRTPDSSSFPAARSLLLSSGAVLALAAGVARAQGEVVEDWARTLTLNGSQIHGRMIAADGNDATYVTGHYPNYHLVTAKLAANGAVLWQAEFSNPGTREHAAWLCVDPFGDVVVAGYLVTGASQTPNGFVTLKYDPAGNLLWSDLVQSTWGSLQRVATDRNGDVVVLGRTAGAVVTRKYSRAGALLWTRSAVLNPFNQSQAGGLAIDANGTIFATGGVLGTMETFAYDPAGNLLWSRSLPAMGTGADLALGPGGEVYVAGTASGVGVDRSLVAKYDAAGTPLWTRTYPGTGARRLAVDGHGDIVIVSAVNPAGGYLDWLTQKLDPAGNRLWAVVHDQHRYNDEVPYALAVGPDDEVYVTGQGGPGPTSGSSSYLRTVTVRYARNGTPEWAAGSFTSVRGLGVVRLSDDSIVTVGESTFTVFHYRQSAVWWSLHGALAGTAGLPHLEGTGTPRSGRPVSLELSRGRPNAPSWIVAGLSRADRPLFGGVLVPALDLSLGAFPLSPSGSLSLPLSWPTGGPPGFEITFQALILDTAAPFWFAMSNALVGISE